MDVIRVRAPSTAHAQRLIASLGGSFSATLDGGDSAAAARAQFCNKATPSASISL